MSPSCPCCSPSCRQHVQKTSEKHNPRANIVQDSPEDASDTFSEPPKSAKNQRKPTIFFNVFRFPTHLLKSSKNAPRTPPEVPKLSSKCPSWRYHAAPWRYHGPSWRHHGPSRTRLDAILAPTSIILRPSSPQLREKFPPKRTKDPKNRTKSAQDPSSLRFSLIFVPSGFKFE